MATITIATIADINEHFQRECEFNERGEITYLGENYPVGYIATGEYDGWLVDTTGDRDQLIKKVA